MFSNLTVDCRWGNAHAHTCSNTHSLTHSAQHQGSHDNRNEMHQQYKKATIMTEYEKWTKTTLKLQWLLCHCGIITHHKEYGWSTNY